MSAARTSIAWRAAAVGLGWSIVQRIAAVHGARLQVGRSRALGGLAVEVQFPSCQTRPAA